MLCMTGRGTTDEDLALIHNLNRSILNEKEPKNLMNNCNDIRKKIRKFYTKITKSMLLMPHLLTVDLSPI